MINLSYEVVFMALVAGLSVSLVSLSGWFVIHLSAQRLHAIVPNLLALAVGVLLGDAFIHLIPDAVERQGSVSEVCLTVLVGMFVFFMLEKLVRWRHDHNIEINSVSGDILPLAKMNLIGDGIHNFVDGILIAGSFLLDPVLGFTTTFAIVVHEIPQELGDVGALVRGGFTPRQAVLLNFYCSLACLPGVIFTLLLGQFAQSSLNLLLPIAAGGFIYIAASDLIPVLHERSNLLHLSSQSLAFIVGVGFMQFILFFEQTLLVS